MVYVQLACRTLVGLVFLAALVGKLRSRTSYREFVAATGRLAPGWLSRRIRVGALGASSVAAEVAVVGLLVVPATVRWGFVLAGVLALVFGVAIVAALMRGERGSCNCFGSSSRPLGAGQLVRNALLITAAGVGLAGALFATGPIEVAGVAVALGAGAVAALLTVTADDVVDLFRPVATAGRR